MGKRHKCLTRDWILGQFGMKRGEAQKRYREFVSAGMRGGEGLWKEVRGQSILGDSLFFEKVLIHVKAHENIEEIPRRQRYVGRPGLSEILTERKIRGKEIRAAVLEHGYSQKEVAEFLGVHYSTISRKVNQTIAARRKI
jgi:putative transposase